MWYNLNGMYEFTHWSLATHVLVWWCRSLPDGWALLTVPCKTTSWMMKPMCQVSSALSLPVAVMMVKPILPERNHRYQAVLLRSLGHVLAHVQLHDSCCATVTILTTGLKDLGSLTHLWCELLSFNDNDSECCRVNFGQYQNLVLVWVWFVNDNALQLQFGHLMFSWEHETDTQRQGRVASKSINKDYSELES